jgi:hypothetical protein
MELTLIREPSTAHSTPGKLLVDGVFECFTLEDVVRPKKIPGETAIPAGTYKVIVNMSNRFKRLLPLLLNVPGFEGVRIHTGNTDKDTEGCILVGTTRSLDFVGNSRVAFGSLFPRMQAASSITITIKDAS